MTTQRTPTTASEWAAYGRQCRARRERAEARRTAGAWRRKAAAAARAENWGEAGRCRRMAEAA